MADIPAAPLASNEGERVGRPVDYTIEECPGGQPDSHGDAATDGPSTSPIAVMVRAIMALSVREALQRLNNSYSGVFPLFLGGGAPERDR